MATRKSRQGAEEMPEIVSPDATLQRSRSISGTSSKLFGAVRKYAFDAGLTIVWIALWAAIVNAQIPRGFRMELLFSIGMLLIPAVFILWHWKDRFDDLGTRVPLSGRSRSPR